MQCHYKWWCSVFIVLQQKKILKQTKVLLRWFCGKKKSVKYTVGGLDCLCRAANAKNVTINIDVHWFHNIKNHEKCYWSSLVSVLVCVHRHTVDRELVLWLCVLLRECLILHQHARALLVVHAASRTHHAYRDKKGADVKRWTVWTPAHESTKLYFHYEIKLSEVYNKVS